MTDKKTRKEIRRIIKKYTGESNGADLALSGGICGGLTAAGVALDLACTGGVLSFGFGTLLFGSVGGLFGLGGAGGVLGNNIRKERVNAAAQTLECTALVNKTLLEMEGQLQEAFKKASTPKTKEKFRLLAAEIGSDAGKLSPAFRMVTGGPYGYGTDKYEFIVNRDEDLSLTEALQIIDQPQAPNAPTPDEEIRQLKARLSALESPKITRLDKKPNNPPSS